MITFPNISLIDYLTLFVDALILLGVVGVIIKKYSSPKLCNDIEKSEKDLKIWRKGLYLAVLSGWAISYFSVISPSPIKFLFHFSFVSATTTTLVISLPAWVCKKRRLSLLCACDIYRYNDFELMLLLGITGSLAFIMLPSNDAAIWLWLFLLSAASILYFGKPKKKIEHLKYPEELALRTLEELQEFLMADPSQRKLITVLKAECDFCKLQAEEMATIPDIGRLYRVIDLTHPEYLDPFILEFLNFEDPSRIKVPTSVIIDNGMSFDRKDGVLTKDELLAILSGF